MRRLKSIGRVAMAVVLACSLGLVMAVPAGAINQDEAPAYKAAGATNVKMLQFDVENTSSFSRAFTGVAVSFSGDSLDDVDNVEVLASDGETVKGTATFGSTPVSFDVNDEPLEAGETRTYYIAIDINAEATDQNSVSVALESIDGGEGVVATATLPFPSESTIIDAAAPVFASAITGDSPDGNSTALNSVYLSFTEEVSGLDPATVAETDFTVDGTPPTSIVDVGADYIILGLGAELATGATPNVTLVETTGEISDLAGNKLAGPVTQAAADGLKPTVSSVVYTSPDVLTLTFSESISLPGVKGDYSVDYAGRDVNVLSVDGGSLDADITLNIEDQSLKDDATDVGEFTVTLNNPGNVKDTSGNSVDPANNSASVDVYDFVDPTDIVSAVTTSTTTIVVTFNEDLDGATVDAAGFSVADNTVDSASETLPGVVTLTLGTAIGTGDTPTVDYAGTGTLTDIVGNAVGNCTDTTPVDGIAPTMDSAQTKSTTTIDVTFSEDLDSATVDAADFSVAGNTVDSASVSGNVVTLTLGTAIATDATPDVTYTAGSLADGSGNTVITTTVTSTDGAGPVLNSVTWSDVNGDDAVNAMDTLTFTFSEAMGTSTITSSNVGTVLPISGGKTYGTGAVVSWTADDTVKVTLATDTTVAIGDTVTPDDDAVTDALGNPDATPAGVKIEDLTDPVLLNGVTYPTIQDAINAAVDGDTIQVGPGTYEENLTIGVSNLTLESTDGAAVTTIEGAITISAHDVTVDGFTMKHTTTIMTISAPNATVKNNILTADTCIMGIVVGAAGAEITGNELDINTTMYLSGGASDCTLSNNAFGAGINLMDGDKSNVTIIDNTIIGSEYEGINFEGGRTYSDILIEGNTISQTTLGDAIGICVRGTVTNLVIKRNNITDNGIGIKLESWDTGEPVTSVIKYNDISGNTDCGIENTSGTPVDATYNYWGSPAGPGSAVTGDVTCSPWLHKSQAECVTVSYPALSVSLSTGWNTLSTPAKLISTADTVADLVPSGMVIAYWYDATDADADGAYWELAATHVLNPCDAVYIKMSSTQTVLFQIDGSATWVPSKDLAAGWNMIGLAKLEKEGAHDAVASVSGSYAQVVSPSMNESEWVFVTGEVGPDMLVGEGYWIFMKEAATLGGFTLCPIAPQY